MKTSVLEEWATRNVQIFGPPTQRREGAHRVIYPGFPPLFPLRGAQLAPIHPRMHSSRRKHRSLMITLKRPPLKMHSLFVRNLFLIIVLGVTVTGWIIAYTAGGLSGLYRQTLYSVRGLSSWLQRSCLVTAA